MTRHERSEPEAVPADWDRSGLPAWTYHSRALLALEMSEVFLTHWQIAGHVADIPRAGDHIAFDIGNERVLVIRGQDGIVRAMHNLCRHRGARLVTGAHGHCSNALVCPFHGWVYNFDGTLRGAARPKSYGTLDRADFALAPIESEIWNGFIFVRLNPGPQPAVARWLAPFDEDAKAYDFAGLVPAGEFTGQELPVNWKSVRDVDNEGYHVAMAHPALQDLYGAGYEDQVLADGLSRSIGRYNAHAGRRPSVRAYVGLAPEAAWLPAEKRRQWAYYGTFPNGVIAAAPETVQFYQEFPVDTDRTFIRGRTYRRPNEDRRTRIARYLARRIDRETYEEDIALSIASNDAMKSAAFTGFHLSDLEYGVRRHHDRLRALLPVVELPEPPAEADMAHLNGLLSGRPGPQRF
ncbi:MAG: aromatic ring-hydroxylating dioxygenase subunit alpha [Rhizobiaceae bacterium]